MKNTTIRISGATILFISLTVMLGWHYEKATLVQIFPNYVPMQFNTALCFFLISISLIMISLDNISKEISLFFGAIVICIGATTLLQYIFGISFGLDEIFMDHFTKTETSHKGRMAPNTSICFVLIGTTILLTSLSIKNNYYNNSIIEKLLSMMALLLSTIAFSGYILKIEEAYGWGSSTKMAIHTSFCFILSSTALAIKISTFKYKYIAKISLVIPTIILALAIMVNLSLPLGISSGILYVPFISCSLWFFNKKATIIFGSLSALLVVIGHFFSPKYPGVEINNWIIIFNRILSIIVIAFITIIMYSKKETEENLISLNNKLENKNKELRKSNEELDQFAHIASHDLKSPLRGINSFSELLLEFYSDGTPLDEKAKEWLRRLVAISKKMNNLIEDLLFFSRVGRDKLAIEPVNLNVLIKNLIDEIKESLPANEDLPQIKIKENLPTISCDRITIKEMFSNLLNNALKYNKSSIKRINIGTKKIKTENEEKQYIYIRDNGIGINKKYHEEMFKIFKRINDEECFPGGTGIGLAFVKKVIEQHNGEVFVDSEEGQGTTFYLEINTPLNLFNTGEKT